MRRNITIDEALDAIPERISDSVVRLVEDLAPTQRMTVTATTGLVLAHLYAEGLIEWTEP